MAKFIVVYVCSYKYNANTNIAVVMYWSGRGSKPHVDVHNMLWWGAAQRHL